MISAAPKWPSGMKCAACITFDCDVDSLIHTVHPDSHQDHAATVSWLQYDQIAVPRIVELFDSCEIKQTFFVPAWCVERYPETFRPVVDSGHEIGHHGYIHESPNLQTPEGERYWFERAIEVIEEFSGRRPVGYRVPWGHLSQQTLELVAEHGFLYDSSLANDYNPYVLKTSVGNVIELPIDWTTIEDWSQYVQAPALGFGVGPRSPDVAVKVWLDEFDEAYEASGLFIATFHPFVSGRPSRLRGVGRMIEHMKNRGDVWITTLEKVAQHVKQAAESGEYEPRRVSWPFYPPERVAPFRPNEHDDALTLRKTE